MKTAVLSLGSNRTLRVTEALVLLLVLGGADLAFSILAARSPDFFYEVNPIARTLLLGHGVVGLIVTKTFFLGIGVTIFWHLRKHARAEWALWGLVLVHVLLLLQWSQYMEVAANAVR